MAIPQSEREIIEKMNLEDFSKKFPVPPDNNQDFVTVLDGKRYSSEAIRAALNALDITIIRELAHYPSEVVNDNNISAMDGSRGEIALWYALAISSPSSEITKQLYEEFAKSK